MVIKKPKLGEGLVRKALSVPLALTLAAGCAPAPAFAAGLASGGSAGLSTESAPLETQAASRTTLHSTYLPVLLRATNGLEEFSDIYASAGDSWSPSYFLFDIAGDGVPELLVRTSSFSGINRVNVYTYDSGSLVSLGSYQEMMGGSAGSSDGQLFSAGWNSGSSYVDQVTIANGAVKTTRVVTGKATTANPSGEVQAVNTYLSGKGASWLSSTGTSSDATLSSNAKFALTKGTLAVASAGTYTGAAKTPGVTVKFKGQTLTAGTDFTVKYANNVNAGRATATISGTGDYQGSLGGTFTISQANISTASVSAASAGAYTGSAKTPAVSAQLGGRALRSGSDFTVAYRNNVNAGTGQATITGRGNYTGSRAVGFAIAKAANPMALKASSKSLKTATVKKAAQTFKAVSFSKGAQGKVTYKSASSASVAKKFTVNKSSGAITAKKGTSKGSYSVKVTATAAGNGNYFAASKTATVKVTLK